MWNCLIIMTTINLKYFFPGKCQTDHTMPSETELNSWLTKPGRSLCKRKTTRNDSQTNLKNEPLEIETEEDSIQSSEEQIDQLNKGLEEMVDPNYLPQKDRNIDEEPAIKLSQQDLDNFIKKLDLSKTQAFFVHNI